MKLDEPKGLPYHNLHRGAGTILVPLFALLLISILALDYHRLRLEAVGAVSVAGPALVVTLSYYKLRSLLIQLDGQLEEKTLSVLWLCANSLIVFGYSACIAVLSFLHPR